MKVLIDLQKDTFVNPLTRSKAKKLEKDLRRFNKVLGLVLLYEILTFFEDLSRHLQSIGLTAELAYFCINKVRKQVKQLREDIEFEQMYEKVEKMGLTCDTSTRSRKVPRRYDDSKVLEELDTRPNLPDFLVQAKPKLNANTLKLLIK